MAWGLERERPVRGRRRFGGAVRRLAASLAAAWLAVAGVSAAQAQDTRWQYPQQYTMSPKGVNLQTGRFTYSKTDLSVGGLKLTRSWGEIPAFAVGDRSLGVLATYTESPIADWAPANVGWSHNFNQGVYYWNGNDTSYRRAHVVVDRIHYTFILLVDGTIGPADQSTQGTRLTWSGSQWQLTDKSGAVFTFFAHPGVPQFGLTGAPMQVIQSAVYPDGTRLDYSYTASGRPRFIASNRGYAIGLEYGAFDNVVAACGFNLAQTYADASTPCAAAPVKVSYAYDSTGKMLTSVTDTQNGVVTMTYVTPPQTSMALPTCISLVNSATCEIQNAFGSQPGDSLPTYRDQVRVQTTATGSVWRYSYRLPEDPQDVPYQQGAPRYTNASMTDPTGRVFGARFDRGHIVSQFTSAGPLDFRYVYRQVTVSFGSGAQVLDYFDSSPGLAIPPEGNREFLAHDSRGNITQHSYWPKGSANPVAPSNPAWNGCCIEGGVPTPPQGSVTFVRTFLPDQGFTSAYGGYFVLGCGSGPADAKLCDKPLTLTDARGNSTAYSYAPEHGGVRSETGPAVNGVQPQTRYTYAQRTAWLKTAGGGWAPAAAPVWVLASKSYCKTGPASGAGCAVAGDEVRTVYEYGPDSGPNNLLLRGVVDDSTGAALRTCFGYDWQGNKASETRPRGTAAGACP